MANFKNHFAARGSIINLLRFEKDLLALDYVNVYHSNVFDYRGVSGFPAKYISIGVHFNTPNPGTFIPSSNPGAANIVFDLDTAFEDAVKYASELTPIATLEDGTQIFDTKTIVYGVSPFTVDLDTDLDKVYRDYRIWSTSFSYQLSQRYKWFGSEKNAKKYVDNISPVLITEDGVPKFAGDKVWYVRKTLQGEFVYKQWQSGIPAELGNEAKKYKYFNYAAGAKTYVDMNKKRYSKQDVMELVMKSYETKTSAGVNVKTLGSLMDLEVEITEETNNQDTCGKSAQAEELKEAKPLGNKIG